MQQFLYYTYQPTPSNHLLAHLLEHCLFETLSQTFKIPSANTGSGYSIICLDGENKLLDDPNDLIEKITAASFAKHKNLTLSETYTRSILKYFTLSRCLEFGVTSVKEIEFAVNEFKKLTFDQFVSEVNEGFLIRKVASFDDLNSIRPPAGKINFAFPVKLTTDFCVVESGHLFRARNDYEGTLLALARDLFTDNINNRLYASGTAYAVRSLLFKPVGNYLFINLSFVTNTLPKIKLDLDCEREFKIKKTAILNDLKEEKESLRNAIMQKLDWGNYLPPKETLRVLQKCSYQKFLEFLGQARVKSIITAV